VRGATVPAEGTKCPAAPRSLLAFVVAAAAGGLLALSTGPILAGDSPAYARGAERLIASGFDLPELVAAASSTYPAALYSLFLTLVVLLKLLFGTEWPVALVALNVLALAGTAALLVRASFSATGSAAAAWAALLLFVACFDLLHWSAFVLSDATFVFVSFAVFALAADRIIRRAGSWVPVFALACVAAFYRPPGVVLLPAAAWAWFLARSSPGALRRAATAAAAAAAVAGSVLFARVMQRPERWPVPMLAGTVQETAARYASGEVVSARLETFHAPPRSVADFAAIAADRLAHFFAFSASDFSLAHTLANAAFFVPAYALAALALAACATSRGGFSSGQRDVQLAAAASILLTAWFHGLLQVDFDWRYRAPILPHLILLAAAGAAVAMRRMRPS
jgi:hypothetical protein